mmetsp:Transcript_34736/g.62538  ORF Transcript_34736/g.62538 Transcript_34736/m.62538 type:complete len:239 (-) Transcript_34736:99-815(-)
MVAPGDNGYSTESFRIGPSETTGALGMFATRTIEKGDTILREATIQVPEQVVRAKYASLNVQVAAAAAVNNNDKSASTFTMGGPNISRANHSCSRWNSEYADTNNVHGEYNDLVAVTRIQKGEEITLCYRTSPSLSFTQPDGTLGTRATNNVNRVRMSMLLKLQFGFVCSCRDCIEDRVCFVCRTTKKDLKRCARCGVVWYCGRECQKADWSQHRTECSGWSKAKQDLEERGAKQVVL